MSNCIEEDTFGSYKYPLNKETASILTI